jgi:hypothetical protein
LLNERCVSQAKLFDHPERERALAEIRRLLVWMNVVVDWEMFRTVLEEQLKVGK